MSKSVTNASKIAADSFPQLDTVRWKEEVGNPADSEAPDSSWLGWLLRTTCLILGFAVAFFILQRLTFYLRFPPYDRTTVWTPGALLFTAFLLSDVRSWWRFLIGLNLGAGAAYWGDTAITVGQAIVAAQFHALAVAGGVWGMRRISREQPWGVITGLLLFVASAGICVPLATTVPIDILRWLNGAQDVVPVALRSLLCTALGLIIATPAWTLSIINGKRWLHETNWKRLAEVTAMAAALFVVLYFAFGRSRAGTAPALMYAPIPILLYVTMRFGLAGVCWAMLAVAFLSTWGAIVGHGPFVGDTTADHVLQLQLFLLAICLPFMFLSVVIEQRSAAYRQMASQEQQLRSQLAQLQTIYQTAPIGLGFVDRQLKFVSVNDYLAQLNGRPLVEHLGRSLRDVLPEIADALEPMYHQVLESGQPILDLELHNTSDTDREQSQREWLVSHYPVLDPLGMVWGVSTVVEEVSERKRVERLQRELTHASRLAFLGEITASIAHEINQPLGAIFSNADAADMLLDRPCPALDDLRPILADIRRDSLRASEVIRSVRKMIKHQEGDMQTLSLNDVVRQAVGLVAAEIRRHKVELRVELDDSMLEIQADRIQLQQVLVNFIVNALDVVCSGQVFKPLIVIRTFIDSDKVGLSVSDTGPGIAPDQLAHVFERFFTTKKEGMGLGLAISRTLIERHGGQVWAENNRDGGATFQLRLSPHAEPHPSSDEAATEAGTP